MNRILLTGTGSGCGKTTVVCAVLRALKNRNTAVHAFKCGPDYIDPMFHSRVLDTPCRNLDLPFFGENTLKYLLQKNAGDSLAVIEGVMGYYDGLGMGSSGSSYDIARVTGTPAVLVVNAKGAARSLMAVLGGFLGLEPDSGIRGVIFNHCSAMLYPMLKKAVTETFGGAVRPLGYLPPLPEAAVESRHLGLITAGEITDLQQKIAVLGEQAEKSIDLDGLLALAAEVPPLTFALPQLPQPGEPVRIAVAQDKAFCFYYADSLDFLRELGAELIEFSPISDGSLPENIHGLYLGGGYPELYAGELANNAAMRQSVKAALHRGVPCIAECGGFLYLQRTLDGEPMVGFFDGNGQNTGKLRRFGYVNLTAKKDGLLGATGTVFPAHEFHYYDVEQPGIDFCAQKPTGRGWEAGFTTDTLYAGFPHFHFYAQPMLAERFLTACRKEKHHAGNHKTHGHRKAQL